MRLAFAAVLGITLLIPLHAQRRLVLIDQDAHGPGGSNQMSMMALLQSPQAEVLGITVVTGDGWRDEEIRSTRQMLDQIGKKDIPIVPGANSPLVRTREETRVTEQIAGKADWMGAWAADPPSATNSNPADEDAAHFLIRQVRAHPGQVTIFAGGPLTNIALAISLDPHFAEMTKGIALMGGSLNPQTDDPEISADPRHEFNFWFDPEAAHIVLRARWPRIDVTTLDVSARAMFTQKIFDEISRSTRPAARYIAKSAAERTLMWDEIAACAWLDPGVITKDLPLYMDVDLSHGPSYGNTLVWDEKSKPSTGVGLVHAQLNLDLKRFTDMFVNLMTN